MSCQDLANEYAKVSGQAIPDASTSVQTRQDWLLKQSWGCYDNSGNFQTDECDRLPFVFKSKNISGPEGSSPIETPAVTVPGRSRNILQESGFLAYTNELGSKCISHITGKYVQYDPLTKDFLNPGTGVTERPDGTEVNYNNELPLSKCATECLEFNEDSTECFSCIEY